MKYKIIAALLAFVAVGSVLLGTDRSGGLAQAAVPAHQSFDLLATKRAAAATCSLPYGSGCLGSYAAGTHGVDGDPATADVLVVGDSIVYRCRFYLRPRLVAYGLTSAYDYWTGRPTEPAVTRLLSYSRTTFKAVVMASGTNDVMNPPVMAAQIERAKQITPPLFWGTVFVARPATALADVRNSGWVNQQIAASGLPLVDWSAFLAAKPSRAAAYLLSDQTHPTSSITPALGDGTGCDAWADVYARRIAR